MNLTQLVDELNRQLPRDSPFSFFYSTNGWYDDIVLRDTDFGIEVPLWDSETGEFASKEHVLNGVKEVGRRLRQLSNDLAPSTIHVHPEEEEAWIEQ